MADEKPTQFPLLTAANLALADRFSLVDVNDTTDSLAGSDKGIVPSEIQAGLRILFANQSVSAQSPFASDTYLVGSRILLPSGHPLVGCTYKAVFDVTKTAAGTATPIINVRVGTAGTTADAARCTFTFGAGTAAIDTGLFEVTCTFRTVGGGTAAVLQGMACVATNLSVTGLTNAVKARVATSAGFDSTVASLGIGMSYNGGASAAHTIQLVRSELLL